MPFDGTLNAVETPAEITFKPRWRQKGLDFRPVIWSLKNRPDEWEYSNNARYAIRHKPSNHEIYVGLGIGDIDLWSSGGCSCTKSKTRPMFRDRLDFWIAFKAWEKPRLIAEANAINKQFASHFLPGPMRDIN